MVAGRIGRITVVYSSYRAYTVVYTVLYGRTGASVYLSFQTTWLLD